MPVYTGQQYDGWSEQYYLRARYYNPKIGRFLQEDVYRGDGLNLYAYCQNNPFMYYDPSGYMGLCPGVKFTQGMNNQIYLAVVGRKILMAAMEAVGSSHKMLILIIWYSIMREVEYMVVLIMEFLTEHKKAA